MLPTMFRFIWPSSFGGDDFFKSANQKQELPVVAMFVNRSGQNEQYVERTFHRCFLPSFSSFGWEVSEEKIKMWKVNGRWTPSDCKSSHCLWQGELKIDNTFTYLNKIPFFFRKPVQVFSEMIQNYLSKTYAITIFFSSVSKKPASFLVTNDYWFVL